MGRTPIIAENGQKCKNIRQAPARLTFPWEIEFQSELKQKDEDTAGSHY